MKKVYREIKVISIPAEASGRALRQLRIKSLSTLIVLAVVCANVWAAESVEVESTGMYSNLEYSDESGGIRGVEIYLVHGGGGHFALVQCAKGDPAAPVVVPVEISGTVVSFKMPEGRTECGASFRGTVSREGLHGRFAGESADRWLLRRNGYWAW